MNPLSSASIVQSHSASDLQVMKRLPDDAAADRPPDERRGGVEGILGSGSALKERRSAMHNSVSVNDLARYSDASSVGMRKRELVSIVKEGYLPLSKNLSTPDSRKVRTVTWGSETDVDGSLGHSRSATDIASAGKAGTASLGIASSDISFGYHITGEQYDVFTPVLPTIDSIEQTTWDEEEHRESEFESRSAYPPLHSKKAGAAQAVVAKSGDERRGPSAGEDGSFGVHSSEDEEAENMRKTENYSRDEEELYCEPIIRDYSIACINQRADACKFNASLAAKYGLRDASQLWNLLSISLSTMAISVPQLSADAKIENTCAQRRSAGLQRSWRDSAIGQLLLQQVLHLCERTGDIQTLATAVCVLGGPAHVAILLAGNHPYFSSCSIRSMYEPVKMSQETLKLQTRYNSVLHAYANILHQWGHFVLCAEVCVPFFVVRISSLVVNSLDFEAYYITF
jgi:hypothetical protein